MPVSEWLQSHLVEGPALGAVDRFERVSPGSDPTKVAAGGKGQPANGKAEAFGCHHVSTGY